ncbi:MAG: anti-sigma factor [Proteobacteria bacterium]|nr:anti-sigma factor [Pseudomonadota bacterium]
MNEPVKPVTVTDELLSAWLDGELDRPEHAAERAAVQAWLHEHPQDAARVRCWAADAEGLRARLAPMLDEPVPAALRATVTRRPFVAARWALAASAAGLLLLGGALGAGGLWQWQQRAASAPLAQRGSGGWVQRAAAAHAVYVPEPRHAVEVKAQEEHLARWLTRRIDVPVKLFDLRTQGFELVGGRLLPDGGGKSAQLMYQDAQGLRVTVYLRKPEVGTPAAFRYERQGELGLFYWVESGAGYALVGALPKEQLLALAQAIYSQGGGKATD